MFKLFKKTRLSEEKKKLDSFFKKRIVEYHKKEVPESECFPYPVHDPFGVVGEDSGYQKLHLIGDNWLKSDDPKPIALMIRSNRWKYGFVAEYLPEYRTAFVPDKESTSTFARTVDQLKITPSVFIIWGYNESAQVRDYAETHNIPIYRMEDGFIRSSLLGASRVTPYSLILDTKGLYYNSRSESGLEDILNNYDFASNPEVLSEGKEALRVVLGLGITKYNQPTLEKADELSLKTKKRVAVIGQVDNDAAIRYGNTNNWNFEELLKLAKYENPDAEIFYRPHPEVYKGYQKSRFKKKRIQYLAKVISPKEPLGDFLETIDHVYVINSLSGLEALIRGRKVTVVGEAFYAGWGLTDDRLTIARRNRKLSLEELFAAIYLIYPRYLGNIGDSQIGLLAACYKIKADKYIETYNACEATQSIFINVGNRFFSNAFVGRTKEFKDKVYNFPIVRAINEVLPYLFKEKVKEPLEVIAESDFWPQLFINKNIKLIPSQELSIIESIRFDTFFDKNKGDLFEVAVIYFMAGALNSPKARDKFIERVRKYISAKNLNLLLLDLLKYYPGTYVYKHIKWLLERNNDEAASGEVLETYLAEKDYNQARRKREKAAKNKVSVNVYVDKSGEAPEPTPNDKGFIDAESSALLYGLLETYRDNYDYENLANTAKKILLLRHVNSLVFVRMADAAMLKADLESASALGRFTQKLNLHGHNAAGLHIEVENFGFSRSEDELQRIMVAYATQLTLKPDRINRSWARLKKYFNSDKYYQIFAAILNLYNTRDINKVVSYIELNRPTEALGLIESLIEDGERSERIPPRYAEILSSRGDHQKAETVLDNSIHERATHANVTEYLRLMRSTAQFEKAMAMVESALDKKIELTYEGHIMPILFGLKRIEQGFKCFTESVFVEKLIKCFGPDKYRKAHDFENFEDVLLIFHSGPSEEMRFASVYNEIHQAIGHGNFRMTCDYRLEGLFNRSFPKLEFVPVQRSRFFTSEYPPHLYDKLPSADLCNILDNDSLRVVEDSKEIKLTTDLLHHFRKDYPDFRGKPPHLVADETRVEYFKDKLPKDSVLIGLSWRSSLTNATRNTHYLSVDELGPLFQVPNVKFVNLQYDECSHELDYIREHYKYEIIDFPELDQMNDFDGVAALMKNLDVVISPLSAVIELAGGLGVNGLLFSNHGETHWRKIDDTNSDVWYDSVKIISEGESGDKNALITALQKEITTNYSHKDKAKTVPKQVNVA